MKFSKLELTVNSAPISFLPYDRGTKGAFVWRQEGASVYAPRIMVSTMINDTTSDKFTFQQNAPRVCETVEPGCAPIQNLGTDIAKTEFRFLASTSVSDRKALIETQIALLTEMLSTMVNREVIYA